MAHILGIPRVKARPLPWRWRVCRCRALKARRRPPTELGLQEPERLHCTRQHGNPISCGGARLQHPAASLWAQPLERTAKAVFIRLFQGITPLGLWI